MAEALSESILRHPEFANALLRAMTFSTRLRELWFLDEVAQLPIVSNGFDWSNRKHLGIDPDAWDRIKAKGIHPLLFFCHPRVIAEQPRLLLYYRSVALISQKGLATLVGGNLAAMEAGKVDKLDPKWVAKVVVALNSILSVMAKTAADLHGRDLPGFQFAMAGATIQGSWNNAVGSEGEAAIKTILINHLRDEIRQIVWKDGSSSVYAGARHASVIDRIADIRLVRLKQGFHLIFASEPDVSLRNPKDIPVVAIEVKAGADPAGALERLGAAMKSFENDRALNPRVKTVYVVRCMTPELQRRISQGSPFDHTFGLSELMADEKTQRVFANLVLRVVLGK